MPKYICNQDTYKNKQRYSEGEYEEFANDEAAGPHFSPVRKPKQVADKKRENFIAKMEEDLDLLKKKEKGNKGLHPAEARTKEELETKLAELKPAEPTGPTEGEGEGDKKDEQPPAPTNPLSFMRRKT